MSKSLIMRSVSNPERPCVCVTWAGVFDAEALRDNVMTLMNDILDGASVDLLHDMREVDFDVPSIELRRAAQLIPMVDQTRCMAVLTSGALAYGMARMYLTLRPKSLIQRTILATPSAATEWFEMCRADRANRAGAPSMMQTA